ncbi:MAG: NYN domain-containing protein [Fibrobacteraceae bacterium]|nr:NYN domain-containing protein [Fibrobacteraceae bacterium]
MTTEKIIALVIDCDNAKADSIYGIMEELSKNGITNIRRAYGNWKGNNAWEEVLHPFAILPIQQFPYTKGKNATDLAMTIDVMDLLYNEDIDVFAIVSSDSDFTPLTMKLRSKGKSVIGFGETKTPQSFIDACNSFIYIDQFKKPTEKEPEANQIDKWDKTKLRRNAKLMKAIQSAIEEEKDDDGWALGSSVSQLINRSISLSPRNFGYAHWATLIQAMEFFDERKNNAGQLQFRTKIATKK